MLVVLLRARQHVRQRYIIPEHHYAWFEDCCCAFGLHCCTTLQIAGHTADYDSRRTACCTESGLSHGTPQRGRSPARSSQEYQFGFEHV
jgi:hypothetical protein